MRPVREISVGSLHKPDVSDIAFGPSERVLVSGDGERLGVWCLDTGRLLYSLTAVCFAVAPNDDLLAVAETEAATEINVVDLRDGRRKKTLTLPKSSSRRHDDISALTFSPDGGLLVVAQEAGCDVLKMPTGEHLFTVPPDHMNGPYGSLFLPHSSLLVVRHYHTVDIWDVRAQQRVGQVKASEIDDRITISPDGIRLACSWGWSGNKNVVEVYSLETYDRLPLSIASEGIVGLAYSPHGQWLVGCGQTFEESRHHQKVAVVQLWDAKTLELVETLRLDEQESISWGVCFSPTGALMASSVNPSDEISQMANPRLIVWDTQAQPASSE